MKTFNLILFFAFFIALPGNMVSELAKKETGNQNVKVTTGRMSNIKETQADCTYKVEGAATEKGICFSDTPSPTINHKRVAAPANAGSTVTSSLNGLKPGTKYFVRAYAKNGSDVVYGNELNFTTLPKGGESQPKAEPKKESKPEAPKK